MGRMLCVRRQIGRSWRRCRGCGGSLACCSRCLLGGGLLETFCDRGFAFFSFEIDGKDV